MLDPIPELSFDSKRHLYSYKGEWLAHSVSAVTGVDITPQQRAGFEKYKHGPDGWAIRGQTIHDCLDKHLRGEPQIYDDKWSPWVETLLEDDLFKNVNLMASEYSLCLRNSSHSIGGTLDFFDQLRRRPNVSDLGRFENRFTEKRCLKSEGGNRAAWRLSDHDQSAPSQALRQPMRHAGVRP